jgi:opacity protein-like surface antigen
MGLSFVETFNRISEKSGKLRALALTLCAAASAPALLTATASSGWAADLSYKDEQPPISAYSSSWAGLYFGVQAGAIVDGDNDLDSVRSGGSAGGAGGGGAAVGRNLRGVRSVGGAGGDGGDAFLVSSDGENSDALVGLHVGYNWQNGHLVYGLEADIDANNSLDTLLGSLRARVGYGTDRTLFYATAGLAYLSVDGGASSVILGGAGGDGGDGGSASIGFFGLNVPGGAGGAGGAGSRTDVNRADGSEFGFVAGVGVEHKLTSQIGLGLEGLYYNFDDNVGVGDDGDFFTVRARLTMHLNRDGSLESTKDSYPAIANWSGFYIGGHAGAAFDLSDSIDSADFNNGGDGGDGTAGIPAPGRCFVFIFPVDCSAGGGGGGGGGGGSAVARLDDDMSFIGGIHVGHNWQSGQWVYGLEGDASFSDNDKYNYLASARARIGYATGSYLFYATGGVAFAGGDRITGIFVGDGQDGEDGGNAVGNGSSGAGGDGGAGGVAGVLKSEDDLVGFVVGAGVDAQLSDRLTLGFEGLYYGFDSDDADVPSGASQFITSDDSDVFVLRSRLSYKLSTRDEPLK